MAINLTTKGREQARAKEWPAVADVAQNDFDKLKDLCARPGIKLDKRDEFEDVGRALRHTARLLWGERVTAPIRLGQAAHQRQILVLAATLDQLLHPDKTRAPKHGSEQYNHVARQRVARWFWAATFAGYAPKNLAEEAEALRAWARGEAPEPDVVQNCVPPTTAEIAAIRFAPGSWAHRAFVTLLGRRNPRDLLTGERLEVDRHFDAAIHGHHLFPRKWARSQDDDDLYRRVDSIVNVAAITGYTNGWIGGSAPEEYVDRILALGVPAADLRSILNDHLVDLDLLHSSRWAEFYEHRLAGLRRLAEDVLAGRA